MSTNESKPFTYLIRVRYYECDAQQVVFNARYGDYVDTAATEFFRALFGDYKNLLAQGLDTQVVKQTIQWQAPARFDDVLAIKVKTGRIGNTSFQLDITLLDFTNGRAIATCEIVYVMVDAANFTKKPIPELIRRQLHGGAPGVIANHAGADLTT